MKKTDSQSPAKATSKHNYGIDALRMFSMLLVVTAHILGKGGILDATAPMSPQYKAAWFLEAMAYCSVDCYALISGYVGIHAKYRYQNIILLWLRVVFYTLSITLLFSLFVPGAVSPKDWIKALIPVTGGYYWYFTAYFALFFFLPILNIAISKMTRAQHRAVAICLAAVFLCLQTFSGKELFGTSSNAWLLMIMYLIGAYIGKYGLFPKAHPVKMLAGAVLAITLTWLTKILTEAGIFPFSGFLGGINFITHTSVTLFSAAAFLLLLFERLQFSRRMERFIRFFSPMAFSVYLIHAHPLIWHQLLEGRFARQAEFPVPLEILSILLTAASIYIVCSLIDLIRIKLFTLLKLKECLGRIEERYLGTLWNQG